MPPGDSPPLPTATPAPDAGQPAPRSAARPRRRWLRRTVWSLVLLIAAFVATVCYVARPAHLRRLLEEGLATANLRVVELGNIAYSPWNGVEFTDLEVALVEDPAERGDPRAHSRVRFGYARVLCDNWALIFGRFRPRDAHVRELTCTLVRDPQGPDWEWPEAMDDSRRDYPALVDFLPRLTIEQADVQLLTLAEDRLRPVRRWRFAAQGARSAAPGEPAADHYDLVLRPIGGGNPRTEAEASAPSLVELRVLRDRIEGAVDWIECEAVIPMLPGSAAAALRRCDLHGLARLDRIVIRDQRVQEMSLQLAGLAAAAPLEENRPAAEQFLQMRDGRVRAALQRAADGAPRFSIQASARLNGAPATLEVESISQRNRPPDIGPGRPTVLSKLLEGLFGAAAEYRVDFVVRDLPAPTLEEHAGLLTDSLLPGEARDFFRNFRPRGVSNIGFEMRGTVRNRGQSIALDDPRRLEAWCEPQGVTVRYYRFPYDIYDVRGRFRTGLDGTFLDGLTGRHGDARVAADGFVANWHPGSEFELRFHAVSVPLNHELYSALPPDDRRTWDERWPAGLCDLDVLVARPPSGPDEEPPAPRVEVDAHLLSGSLRTPDGRRLEQAEGRLSIRRDTLRIEDLQGFMDGAAVRLSGEIRKRPDGASETQMQVQASGMAITREHRMGGAERTLRYRGLADAWGRMFGAIPGADPRDQFTLRLNDGVIEDMASGQTWREAGGDVILNRNELRLIGFTAMQDGATLTADGVLPQGDSTAGVTLDLNLAAADLGRAAPALAPPDWAQSVREAHLSGPGQLGLRLRPPAAADQPASANVQLEAAAARPQLFPLALENLRAAATIAGGKFDLHSLTADLAAGGHLRAIGAGSLDPAQRTADLNVVVDELALTPELIDTLPPNLRKPLAQLDLAGMADLNLDRIEWRAPPDGPASWRVDGGLRLSGARMRIGLPLTECTGEISGGARMLPDGSFETTANFVLREGRLAGRPLRDWDGQVSRPAGARWLKFSDLRGTLCGGSAVANVQVDPRSGDFELSLVMRDVLLDEFLQRSSEADAPRSGVLDGHVFLRGVGADVSARRGQGEMTIVNASFLKLPVLASVAQAGRERDPTMSDTVSRMSLRYNWEGAVLKFDRVVVESADLRLVGAGWWDTLSDRIDLTLVGAHPRDWPRVAIVTDLLERAGQELMQYRVTGVVSSPQVRGEPLAGLSEPLRQLLRE